MSAQKIFAPLVLIAACCGTAWSSPSQARHIEIDVRVAPPALRVERIPHLRHGYAWVPGYWRWNGHRHVWVSGYRVRERSGYHYYPAHWEPRGPHWHFHPGYWDR